MPTQCSAREWETPSTSEKGSLETAGFKLTFAYFCSAAKVGRRRPTVGPSRLPGAARARQPGPCLESGSLSPPPAALRRFPLGRDCQNRLPAGMWEKHQNRQNRKCSTAYRRMPPAGREENGQGDGLGRYPPSAPTENGRPPATSEKGSLETAGFKLTFAHFCSVTKVGRRRQSLAVPTRKSLAGVRNNPKSVEEKFLFPAAGRPLWGGKRRMQRPDLGDTRPALR